MYRDRYTHEYLPRRVRCACGRVEGPVSPGCYYLQLLSLLVPAGGLGWLFDHLSAPAQSILAVWCLLKPATVRADPTCSRFLSRADVVRNRGRRARRSRSGPRGQGSAPPLLRRRRRRKQPQEEEVLAGDIWGLARARGQPAPRHGGRLHHAGGRLGHESSGTP